MTQLYPLLPFNKQTNKQRYKKFKRQKMLGTAKIQFKFQKHIHLIQNGVIEINSLTEEKKYKIFLPTNGKMNWIINLKKSFGHLTTIVLLYDLSTNIETKMVNGIELTETKIGNLMKMD